MKGKAVVSLLALLCFFGFGAASRAQEMSKIDVFAGYSYVEVNPKTAGFGEFHLNGGSASAAYNVNHWLSAVADFGGYTNPNIFHTGAGGTAYTYLFGPRISYRHRARITPFAQALFGGAHANANTFATANGTNAFAMTLGGGIDYRFNRHFSIRPVQAEYLFTRFPEVTTTRQTQNNLRLSGGFVFHF